ncbi:MAG: UPF0280 family protein [Rhizobiaceae bacterium]
MSGFTDKPVAAISRDGRKLSLRHGPIDLLISADGEPSEVQAAYRQAVNAFDQVLPELVSELQLLRRPVSPAVPEPVGNIARAMHCAALAHCDRFVTSMVAVAGAVADNLLSALVEGRALQRAFVNNGGDIALYLRPGQAFDIGICSNPVTGEMAGTATVEEADRISGIATSGWRGRSHSLGVADAVTVLSRDAATADAAATIISNEVNIENSPHVVRERARDLSPDSDLGERLVTVDVGDLSPPEITQALDCGERLAARLLQRGNIASAFICLAGDIRIVGGKQLAVRDIGKLTEGVNA